MPIFKGENPAENPCASLELIVSHCCVVSPEISCCQCQGLQTPHQDPDAELTEIHGKAPSDFTEFGSKPVSEKVERLWASFSSCHKLDEALMSSMNLHWCKCKVDQIIDVFHSQDVTQGKIIMLN